jgi:hypothetical protein
MQYLLLPVHSNPMPSPPKGMDSQPRNEGRIIAQFRLIFVILFCIKTGYGEGVSVLCKGLIGKPLQNPTIRLLATFELVKEF